jgi:hypothetical protein
MATRTKTVEFAHPFLAAVVDNTLTPMTQITVYLPETGKTFRSVYAIMSINGTGTAQGNVTSRNLQCRLGANAYAGVANANLYTGSGEDIHLFHAVDLTAHFTSFWTGTSMTFDSQVQVDGTWAGVAWTNCCVRLVVTYDYDDTSATQVKTVRIPLNAPASALATSQPSALTTIPDLDVELPETGKTYRNQFITVQGNVERAGAGDLTLNVKFGILLTITTGVYEGVGSTDYFYSFFSQLNAITQYNPTSAQDFFIWASATDFDHPQVWLTVTYEFDATGTTDCFVSLMIPAGPAQTMGGTTSSDFLRLSADVWIPEADVISKQIAFFPFWTQAAAIAGLNMRVGTGAFVAYSSVAATVAGSCAAMIRNDAAFTLARGKNTLTSDVYRTDTSDLGAGVGGFWIVNYTCDKPSAGYGAANRTVLWNNGQTFNGTAVATWLTSNINTPAGFTSWTQKRFISSFGMRISQYPNSTGMHTGLCVMAERKSTDTGGQSWLIVGGATYQTDAETGLLVSCMDFTPFFKQWDNTVDNRMDLATARRWRISIPGFIATGWAFFEWMMTYHEVTFTVADSVSGFSGTVTIGLHLERDSAKGIRDERVLETTRSGDGAFSFTWYDPVEQVYVVASDGTNVGRSTSGVAT